MPRLLLLALLIVAGCASAEERFDRQVRSCVAENSAFESPDLFMAFADLEEYLIREGALGGRSKEAYQRLIVSLADSTAHLPSFQGLCGGFLEGVRCRVPGAACQCLITPASQAAYPVCLTEDDNVPVDVGTSRGRLQSVAENLRHDGDMGPAYLQEVLDAMSPEMFEKPLYRGSLLQVIAVYMYRSSPPRLGA